MALNIKNAEVERLVDEVAAITGETKTEAVRRALEERAQRLSLRSRRPRTLEEALAVLQRDIWSMIPSDKLGRPPLTREEEDEILGFDPDTGT